MDLKNITDVQQLKALAYDEMQRMEISKQNLQLINQRLYELEQAAEDAAPKKSK